MTRVYAAIDVDGVVLDLVRYITERLDLDPSLWKTWEFHESYSNPEHVAEVERLFKHVPDMFVHAKPYSDARDGVLKLLDNDINFCFMSSFPPEFFKLREWWLWYNLMHPLYPQYDNGQFRVRLLRVPSELKASVCSLQGVTHMLEDKRETAEQCIEKGVRAYLVPRVYNRPAFDSVYLPDATIDQFADMLVHEARQG